MTELAQAKKQLDEDMEIESYRELLRDLRKSNRVTVVELGVDCRKFHEKDIYFPVLCRIRYNPNVATFSFSGKVGQVITDQNEYAPMPLEADDFGLILTARMMQYMKTRMLAERQKLSQWFTQEQLGEFDTVVGWYMREYQ